MKFCMPLFLTKFFGIKQLDSIVMGFIIGGNNASIGRNLKIMIPLAYFFTLLKPSDVDGAMTPLDINQLILTPTMNDVGHFYKGINLRHNKS